MPSLRDCTLMTLPLALLACGGEGEILVSAYGEAFVEEGIAPEDMSDGWRIDFDQFEVGIRDVEVAGERLSEDFVVELTRPSAGEGHPLAAAQVAPGQYRDHAFTLGPIALSGTAVRSGETKRFDWRFEGRTRYDGCEAETEVEDGAAARLEITVHADHLFFDSLVAEEPVLGFQPLADADQDGDGVITPEELAAADIGAYDPGSAADIDDLWSWLSAQASLVGHVDGEGHCRARPTSGDPS